MAAAVPRIGLRNPLLPAETCPHDTIEEARPLTGQRIRRCNDCGELVVAADVERMRALANENRALRAIAEGTCSLLLEESVRDGDGRELARAQLLEALPRWRRDFPPAGRK